MGYKKRKPFLLRLFLWIFWLAFILALIFGGLWAYLYFGKNVDLVGAIGQINAIATPVGKDDVSQNPITETDKTSIETKTNVLVLSEDITISGGEFGAFINKAIAENGLTVNTGTTEINLQDWNFEVIETTFENITDNTVSFNVIFKFDTENLSAEMKTFPLSLISLPETMYITSTCTINIYEDLEYSLSPVGISIGALSLEETTNILGLISVFVANFDADELSTAICQAFLSPLLGSDSNSGLVQNLSAKAPVGFEANYHFEMQGQTGVFVIDLDPAVYEVSVRQKLGDNHNANVAEITGTGEIYGYGDSATLTVSTNAGYTFEGWYSGSNLVCALETYTIPSVTSDMVVYAKFSYITKTITYISSIVADNPNPETYNISSGNFALLDLSANGYKFLGWFTEATGGNKVNTINASSLVDVTVYAHWEVITYTIAYNLNSGVISGSNPATYTVETDTFTILNPTKIGTEFTGWTGTNLNSVATTLTIEKGTYGDLVFTAHYLNDTTVFLYVDGVLEDSFQVNNGEVLSNQSILNYSNVDSLNSAAYTIQNWYTNPALTTPYSFTPVMEDISLYTTLEYFTDKLFFYPYLDEFNSATQNKTKMTFNTQDKLLAWIDYVLFYRVMYSTTGGNPTFNLTYITGDNTAKKDEVQNVYRNIYAYKTKFQTTAYGITYSCEGFFLSPDPEYTDPIEIMASKTADPSHTMTQPQQDSGLLLKTTTSRSANFDNFKINQITKTVSVTNSEQLVHVLEQGYKPLCVPGSGAEKIYNKAKAVLREICTDAMSDFEKLRAIYEWLIMNVQYDHYAAANYTEGAITRHYRAWFAEGVFLDKVAVCEGLAKATVILSRIENIPAIIVTNPTHAWNKVVVDGKWYGFDTTHGNIGVNGQEVLSYTKFLSQTASQTFNYYQKAKITHHNQTFDLVIESQAEMTQMLEYVASNQPNNVSSTYFTIEIVVDSWQMSSWLNNALAGTNLRYFSNVSPQTTNTGHTAYILMFYK